MTKHVLHDWDDAACERILRHCHAALPRGGRLVIIEMVVPPPGQDHLTKLLDLEMLVIADRGREGTAEEFERLVAAAGFELFSIVPTASPVALVESRRV